MSTYGFGKNEKLCSKRMTDALFASGRSFKAYPLRVFHLPVQVMDVNAKVLITVPKKRFKKAVTRNRIKRLIRETYRLNRNELREVWLRDTKYFALAFVYIGTEMPDYDSLNESMKQVLNRLISL